MQLRIERAWIGRLYGKPLTGERVEDLEINAIKSVEPTTQVDFVELFNPGNFKAQKGTLIAGQTYDVKVNPAMDLARITVQEQTRLSIAKEDPMILIGAPPCTVFSPMQNINQKHQQALGIFGLTDGDQDPPTW